MCLQSCAVTLCSSVLSAGSASLSFTVHYLSLRRWSACVHLRVYMCVKPVTFCALTSVCLSLWLIPISRACVYSICVCLSAYTCTCVCLCARQMFPGRCHCSAFTHVALRKINQHFIYPFASWVCPPPPPNSP